MMVYHSLDSTADMINGIITTIEKRQTFLDSIIELLNDEIIKKISIGSRCTKRARGNRA